MPLTASRRPFARQLRALGYALDVTPGAGRDILVFEKIDEAAGRRVDVQLWRDGLHRAANGLGGGTAWRWSTSPTYFRDLAGMTAALAREWSRTDHAPEA